MSTIFAAGPHISIAPDTLFHVGPLAVTNAQILGLIGTALVVWMLLFTVRKVKQNSRNRFAHAVLWIFESLYDTIVEVIGDKTVAKKILPLAVTLVFFFIVNNWLGLLPIVGSITYNHEPLLRGAAADLNMTLGLAVVSMTTAQIWAIRRLGFVKSIGRYFHSPFKDPIHAAEGILELIAEFSRTVALSLRIFGNVFGGEVLLGVIAFLTSYAAPLALPLFYGLELFVGAVQAYVFFMLTIVFISLGLPNNAEPHEETSAAQPESAVTGTSAKELA
jgi:F-type H+-transporting ATPase subunit a